MTLTSTLTVHQAIARSLVDNGIKTVFGLIGDANLYIVDAYIREFGGKYVSAAHEGGAVLMALGHANFSGKVAVATVTHGPAMTNMLTALVEGVRACLPVVVLCGDTDVVDQTHHQNIAQRELIVATGAGFQQMRSPETALIDLADCLRRATIERRPVVLNMPSNFQWQQITYQRTIAKVPDSRSVVPASEDLDNAIGIIAAAKRPVILAGKGATSPEARLALLKLAERIEAPLATSLKAKDLFRGEDFNLGVCGTLSTPETTEIILSSDCIIALGAGLNKFTMSNGAFATGKRIVQCHTQLLEIGRYFSVDAGLVGDAALTANEILRWLDEAEIPPSGFRDETMREKLRNNGWERKLYDDDSGETVDIRNAMVRFNDAMPENRVVVTDGGRFESEPWRIFDVQDPQSFLITINFGSIGLGMGQAIGASFAAEGRPVVLITGDGGFMLGGLTEFSAAVRHNVDLVVIVCNDGGYGAEHIQFRNKNRDPSLSILGWPDFGPVATALGGTGFTVRCEADFDEAIKIITQRNRPVLIDVKLDPDRFPGSTH